MVQNNPRHEEQDDGRDAGRRHISKLSGAFTPIARFKVARGLHEDLLCNLFTEIREKDELHGSNCDDGLPRAHRKGNDAHLRGHDMRIETHHCMAIGDSAAPPVAEIRDVPFDDLFFFHLVTVRHLRKTPVGDVMDSDHLCGGELKGRCSHVDVPGDGVGVGHNPVHDINVELIDRSDPIGESGVAHLLPDVVHQKIARFDLLRVVGGHVEKSERDERIFDFALEQLDALESLLANDSGDVFQLPFHFLFGSSVFSEFSLTRLTYISTI